MTTQDLGSAAPLWTGLIDDAAVFPPGNAPLDVAVRRHLAHKRSRYAGLIGPLLVPASDVGTLVAEARSAEATGLEVGLIARPGVDPSVVVSAVERLADEDGITAVGAELGWFAGWRGLSVGSLPLTLEVPRGEDRERALADVRAAADSGGRLVQAKFRTGATPTWEWPDEAELAALIHDCARLGIPFKLTGGLHHAVRAEHDADPQHGVLNVILAVHSAARDGALPAVEALLAQRDSQLLTDAVLNLDDADATRLRSLFTAYGCCEVTDPIGELEALGALTLDHDEENPS